MDAYSKIELGPTQLSESAHNDILSLTFFLLSNGLFAFSLIKFLSQNNRCMMSITNVAKVMISLEIFAMLCAMETAKNKQQHDIVQI